MSTKQCQRLQLLLPPEKPKTGRPNLSHRQIINGILWLLRTGAPWRDIQERYGIWSAISSRFYRWRQAGLWDRLWAALQGAAEQQEQLDWELYSLDASVIRAHQHAAGAKKTPPDEEA